MHTRDLENAPPLPTNTVDIDSVRRALLGRTGEDVMDQILSLYNEDLSPDRLGETARRQARLYALLHALALKP